MIRELEFKILCRKNSDEVYRYARSLLGNAADAEDATQEVLLKLWRNWEEVSFFNTKGWLLRTTRNYCLDQIRRRSNRTMPVFVDDCVLNEYADEFAERPDQVADFSNMEDRISSALLQLPETLRSAFVLYEINGLRYREIARTLDIPINSVKVYISRARKKLQNLLTEEKLWTSI